MIEIGDLNAGGTHPTPPKGKKVSSKELLETFGANPDFPSIEEIRSNTWPSKW